MTRKFELEKRVLLESRQVKKFISFLDKKAVPKGGFRRFSIILWKHAEPEPDTAASLDFRIRITKKKGLFTLKYGDWRGGGREEYEFYFDVSELASVLNLMRVLGYKWGTTTYLERGNYKYRGMNVTLDRYLDDGKAVLEIETVLGSKNQFKEAEKKIDAIFAEWGLKPFDKADFVEFIRYTNNKKKNYFDFTRGRVEKYIRLWEKNFK